MGRDVVLAGWLFMISVLGVARAQDTTVPHVVIQDSIIFMLKHRGVETPASWFSPAYLYEMVYDSMSHTNFTFTECRRNGELLKLLSWNYNRLVYAPSELMTYNSRTANIAVRAGDTISFYRELMWYNPMDRRQDTNNYYSLDTLELCVHLVDGINGQPLAQLDSLGVLPCVVPGMPTIYGVRPIMALVTYVVPSSLDGDSVFVGVTVRAKGSGPHYFTRLDFVTVGLSERLKQAKYIDYLAAYGVAYGKRNPGELMQMRGQEQDRLTVLAVPGSPRDIRIMFKGPRNGGYTSVVVYDGVGNLVFYPYSSRTSDVQSEVIYRAPASGSYFVALVYDGTVVGTERMIITH